MKKGTESVFPILMRQTGENAFRIASAKDQNEGQFLTSSFGMSTRLYLAGMAMQGILAAKNSGLDDTPAWITFQVGVSLLYADELLKQEEETR